MTALVVGATGLVGSACVRRLAGHADVTALVRRPGTLPKGVREMVVDFDRLEDAPAPAADSLFCALGTTIRKAGSQEAFRRVDFDLPLRVARWARAAGARQCLLVSSVGADPRSGTFYLRVKGELEEALAGVGFEALHVFRPSFLMGERAEPRRGERIAVVVARGLQGLLVGPLRRYRPIEAKTVAAAMVLAAERGGAGRHVYEYEEIVAQA